MALPYDIEITTAVDDKNFDGIVLVTDKISTLPAALNDLKKPLEDLKENDKSVEKDVVFTILQGEPFNNQRLVFSPTGPLDRDYDDVRRYSDAALTGIERALKAGCKAPLLVSPPNASFTQSQVAAALGALRAVYVPLEVREATPDKAKKIDKLGIWNSVKKDRFLKVTKALESGRSVARDIGGSDPERMAAPNVATYVTKLFEDPKSGVAVKVIKDEKTLEREYPLHAAVNRCAKHVDRHKGCVIELEYVGDGEPEVTVMLVGKGVTMDTGGVDIKISGGMRSMHRDKCGAAAVAGFFQILSALKPPNIKVLGAMTMVRNSVGSDSYVPDEILTARSGVRVRVGNTDAEGRMAMADPLCKMKELALNEKNPHIYTIATLTGHAVRTVGPGYTIVMDNGPAREANHAQNLAKDGADLADPLEVSTIRREDYEYNKSLSPYEDMVQTSVNPASGPGPRGHQNAAAFLLMISGLDKHGLDSESRLRYSHLDIAASSGPYPGLPVAAPIVALGGRYLLPKVIDEEAGDK
ncbi:putative aminopeptidase W07G4.4 [Ptychodera flava]|uniref:putative aminopeptidase W07G4.4 n=1 Tax=Ptychodera flava TaxID=63121 RepID=UPI00396A15B1